ncbi:TlpA family protein disulfide reductase [Paenibacillus sp. GCM10012307]|uniref:TlpA family protein disulfide reductase n=1 Tax=Paenibacillus roseus TaxID=2798579 RepID=A0A934IV19_9BACL|nr:TlpA disulfide reductase family protein [Paenibacillus roseus]MBJ6359851.1 TlpA family protein disulfide reductase [Paenibacillus roseus]
MKKIGIIVAACVFLIFGYFFLNDKQTNQVFSSVQGTQEALPKPGYLAPPMELPALDEQNYAVGDRRDKLLLLNFWASWCGPCELEAPDLVELSKKYETKMDVYGVNATSYDRERQARQFVEDFELNFPILMDRDGVATKLYKVTTFPTTLLIDQNGVVQERILGVIPREQWEKRIDALLDKPDAR